MSIHKYVRVYAGYFLAYMSYKIIFYTLSQICNQVDEMIANENNNFLPDEIKDISTTHSYNIGKEIVNILRTRGGQGAIIIKPEGVIILGKNVLLLTKLFAEKVIIIPLSKAMGFIIMRFPVAKKVYTAVNGIKVIIASIAALVSLGVIARFDYWALIITDSVPQLPIETKIVLSGIRRIRIGKKDLSLCILKSNEVLNLVMDEDIPLNRKKKY